MGQEDYSVNELLRFLKSEKKKKLHKNDKVKKFIDKLEIKPSEGNFVPNYLIYYHFYLWNTGEKIKRVHFFKLFGSEFQAIHKSKVRGYMIESKHIDDSVKMHYKAREYQRREREWERKRRKKLKGTNRNTQT